MSNNRKFDKEKILPHAAIFSASAGILAAAAFACLPLASNVKWLDVPIIIAGVTALFSMIFYVDSVSYPRFIKAARYLFLLSVLMVIVVVILYFVSQSLLKTAIILILVLFYGSLWIFL